MGVNIEGGTFLVTGGAGFIPSHLIDMLLKHKAMGVVSFDNFSRGNRENISKTLRDERLEFHEGDLRNSDFLNEITKGIDGVFHMASMCLAYCQDHPWDGFDVNVNGTFRLLEACAKNGVDRFVCSSSSSVYGNASYKPMDENHPLNNETFYGATKICDEVLAKAFFHKYGIPTVNLRYMNVYGPRQDYSGTYVAVIMKIIDNIQENLPPTIYGDGSQNYDFVYVDDICRANLCAMLSDRCDESYNISSGIQTSVLEVAELIMGLMDYHGEVSFLPTNHQGLVTDRIGSIDKAAKDLGFKSTVALRDGLKKTINWRKGLIRGKKRYGKGTSG